MSTTAQKQAHIYMLKAKYPNACKFWDNIDSLHSKAFYHGLFSLAETLKDQTVPTVDEFNLLLASPARGAFVAYIDEKLFEFLENKLLSGGYSEISLLNGIYLETHLLLDLTTMIGNHWEGSWMKNEQ